MNAAPPPHPAVRLGVVPTHLGFARSLVPDAHGRLPRDESGQLRVVAGMTALRGISPVSIECVQVSTFPGADADDMAELIGGLRALGMEVGLVLMVAGANPMNPADEDRVVGQLLPGVRLAMHQGIRQIASTSIEQWMDPHETRREGAAFDAAVAQNVRLHRRIVEEAALAGSCVESWHIEFLRPGEFRTFTCLDRAWTFVREINRALGRPFFKLLVDAAHCGDSGLPLERNVSLIRDIAAAGELGVFHASARTNRGRLTDDASIGTLLEAAAATGQLREVLVEVFDHADPALDPLRALGCGFGADTRRGCSYAQVVANGLAEIARWVGTIR